MDQTQEALTLVNTKLEEKDKALQNVSVYLFVRNDFVKVPSELLFVIFMQIGSGYETKLEATDFFLNMSKYVILSIHFYISKANHLFALLLLRLAVFGHKLIELTILLGFAANRVGTVVLFALLLAALVVPDTGAVHIGLLATARQLSHQTAQMHHVARSLRSDLLQFLGRFDAGGIVLLGAQSFVLYLVVAMFV